MAAVYQEIELTWEGKTYKVTPTFSMIQRIEQTLSIAGMMHRAATGNSRFSELARLLGIVLSAAGCKGVKEEEIYEALYFDESAVEAAILVLNGVTPQRKSSLGNGEAPRGATSKSPPTSTGESSTKSPSDTLGSNPQNSGG